MTTHHVKAAALKPGDMLLDAPEYMTVVRVQSAPRDPKRIQVTLRSRHDKEITLFLERDATVEVRRP